MKKKNKEPTVPMILLRNLILGILAVALLVFVYQKMISSFKHSARFKIREIVYDPSLQFLSSSRLSTLKGRNIFDVDLKNLQRQLQLQYPEIAQLKLIKRFPDQIAVSAKRRLMFAQSWIKNKEVVLDPQGVILSVKGGREEKNLPVILGINAGNTMVSPGVFFNNAQAQTALRILTAFRLNKFLSSYKISKIDVSNLSKIEFYLTDTLKIIADQTNIPGKIQLLGLDRKSTRLNSSH